MYAYIEPLQPVLEKIKGHSYSKKSSLMDFL
jgi:hypothetical protein